MTAIEQDHRDKPPITIHPAELRAITTLLKERSGIALSDASEQMVIARLARHLHQLGLGSFAAYLEHLRSPQGEAELPAMIEALTTTTTRFFRESGHFALLRNAVLPPLIARLRGGGRARLWSAGCSTGEEAYSIAAILLAACPEAGQLDVKILATDINDSAIARALAGIYETRRIGALDFAMRHRMFATGPADRRLVIRDELRSLVVFRHLNLIEPWPISGRFDVIFCRNVAIYMDPPTRIRLWHALERVLGPEGVLFVGHSECPGSTLHDRLESFAPSAFRRRRRDQPECSSEGNQVNAAARFHQDPRR